VAWPFLRLTGSITLEERTALLGVFWRRTHQAAVPLGPEAEK
jgi:hypothetical protein